MNANTLTRHVTVTMGDLHMLGAAEGKGRWAYLAALQQEHRADLLIEMQWNSAGHSSIQLMQIDGEELN